MKRTTDELSPRVEDRIRNRAYELYEQGGKQDGYDLKNWLQAESEVKLGDLLEIADSHVKIKTKPAGKAAA